MFAFSDLATTAYCPRQLYYRRKHDDFGRSPEAVRVRELAYRSPELLDETRELPPDGAVTPTQFRTNLSCVSERLDAWEELVDPSARDVLLEGREACGIAHKVLEAPLAPSFVFAGDPPPEGAAAGHRPTPRGGQGALVGARDSRRTGVRGVSHTRRRP